MSHKNRRRQHVDHRTSAATTSICGLVAYQHRDDARRAAKQLPTRTWSDVGRARAYQCRGGCELWHVGYLPQLVIDGLVTAAEWYGYHGRRPLKDELIPLIAMMRRRTGGSAQILRRTGADDTDLWGAMVETGRGTFIARDHATPARAVRAVLAAHDAADDRKDAA